jgi:tRNA dimethylallyltransferase
LEVVAIFGPTAIGKTGIAIELAKALRERGEDPVAVGCDAIQVYRGLEVISGAPTQAERQLLEHRLVGVAGFYEEFSVGRFAELAHPAIDHLLESASTCGRRWRRSTCAHRCRPWFARRSNAI